MSVLPVAPPAPAPEAKPVAKPAGGAVGRADEAAFARLLREERPEPEATPLPKARPAAAKDRPLAKSDPAPKAKAEKVADADADTETEPGAETASSAEAAPADAAPVETAAASADASAAAASPAAAPDQTPPQPQPAPVLTSTAAVPVPQPAAAPASEPAPLAVATSNVGPALDEGLAVLAPALPDTAAPAPDAAPAPAAPQPLQQPAAPTLQVQAKAPAIPVPAAQSPAQEAAAQIAELAPPPSVQSEAVPVMASAPLVEAQVMAALQAQPGQAAVQPSGQSAAPAPGKTASASSAKAGAQAAANAPALGLFGQTDPVSAQLAVQALASAGEEGANPDAGADLSRPAEVATAETAPAEAKGDASGQPIIVAAQPGSAAAAGLATAKAHAGTAASLASEIVRKSEGKASRFEVSLDPHGLGQVTVSVRIDAQGRLSAALAFDNPAAAAQLNARSGELRNALEQAGFDLSQGGLSFDSSAGQGSGQNFENFTDQGAGASRGRAFGAASQTLDLADIASAQSRRTGAASGLDLRI